MSKTRICVLFALAFLIACGEGDRPGKDSGPPDAEPDVQPDASPDGLVVRVSSGGLRGTESDGVRAFLAIPFAAPPTGELRWRAPLPPEPWEGVRDATARGAPCPQVELLGDEYDERSSEDCLTLNVWSPTEADGTLPVLVWIYGGGFESGTAGDPMYDGVQMARTRRVVLVTLNYRIGALGFLAHPELADAGVFGLLDQRAAMQWVQENAAAFGGDPDNVTIFGESAGGISVCLHLISPDSRGLFRRAIMESGSCAMPFASLRDAEEIGARLTAAVGCDAEPDQLACLRTKDPRTLVTSVATSQTASLLDAFAWFPPVDGEVIPDQPRHLIEQGAFAQVPILLGTNTDEGSIFVFFGYPDLDEAGYEQVVRDNVGDAAAGAVLEHYPADAFDDAGDALATVLADGLFVCPTRRVARAFATAGQPVFLYSFGYAPGMPFLPDAGAFHGSEIPFVFDTGFLGTRLNDEERTVADAVQAHWAAFAEADDPSTTSTDWPGWQPDTEQYLFLDLPLPFEAESHLRQTECDFWDGLALSK